LSAKEAWTDIPVLCSGIYTNRTHDILLLLNGEIILIDIPEDVEEAYQPLDPRDGEQGGGTVVPRRGR